ncbi:MAG: Dabb family protein [Phycisphaeraceae bacterium]|nr:Dabb family protein [Phycisphaeraceae bacterium]
MVGGRLVMVTALVTMLSGCAGVRREAGRPALIEHVVFVKLKDPGRASALIAESDRVLRPIPGVVAYAAGQHLETGRTQVIADYDVAMFIGFDSEEDYASYVSHPSHVGIVDRWKPEMEWLRVYDFLDAGD